MPSQYVKAFFLYPNPHTPYPPEHRKEASLSDAGLTEEMQTANHPDRKIPLHTHLNPFLGSHAQPAREANLAQEVQQAKRRDRARRFLTLYGKIENSPDLIGRSGAIYRNIILPAEASCEDRI